MRGRLADWDAERRFLELLGTKRGSARKAPARAPSVRPDTGIALLDEAWSRWPTAGWPEDQSLTVEWVARYSRYLLIAREDGQVVIAAVASVWERLGETLEQWQKEGRAIEPLGALDFLCAADAEHCVHPYVREPDGPYFSRGFLAALDSLPRF